MSETNGTDVIRKHDKQFIQSDEIFAADIHVQAVKEVEYDRYNQKVEH